MKLIVGLGNPGSEYENTRHNVGFMVLDAYCEELHFQKKFDGLLAEQVIDSEKVLFLKPQTFMNLSGNAVFKVAKYYAIAIEDILIIQDDMDLDFGKFKVKCNSSSGGHNGIKSIITCLKSEKFARLKIGISHDQNGEIVNYVLGKFSKSEREVLEGNMPVFKKIIDTFIKKDLATTMQVANTR